MDDVYSPEDHYCYANSAVLKNRLGLKTLSELEQAERLFVNARLIEMNGVPRTFDHTHFRALHFHMFQDVYDWAGMERDVFIIKGQSPFASPLHIRQHCIRILSELRSELLAKRHDFGALPAILSRFVNEMNVVHAFREGNGRHLREFVRQVLEELGCGFAAGVLQRERWIPAVIAGFKGDESPMAALLEEAIITPATNREKLFAPLSKEKRSHLCALLKRSGYPADIMREYRATLRCE
ncbi:MAG: Fic family protein [Desulfovibrio sp.]|nr:Fic family protein [Desulfovibrio sp.]